MNNDIPTTCEPNRRHSFSGRLWKQLRSSKRNQKAGSFISYSDEDNRQESYISRPTNFEHREIDRRDFSLDISIQECPFDVTGYGNLIMKDKFKLRRPKKKKITVFLFEKIVVFTTTAKKGEELYYYFGSIKISNLSLAPPDHNVTKILLKDFVNSKLSKHAIEYKLEAATAEIQNSWRDAFEKCLWKQLVQAKDDNQNG